MAKAFKCDRCKELYEPYTIEQYQWFKGTPICVLPIGSGISFDLCSSCMSDLMLFMKGHLIDSGKLPNCKEDD